MAANELGVAVRGTGTVTEIGRWREKKDARLTSGNAVSMWPSKTSEKYQHMELDLYEASIRASLLQQIQHPECPPDN